MFPKDCSKRKFKFYPTKYQLKIKFKNLADVNGWQLWFLTQADFNSAQFQAVPCNSTQFCTTEFQLET